MSHPVVGHDRENERVEDSKFAPKRKIASKMSKGVYSQPIGKYLRERFEKKNKTK